MDVGFGGGEVFEGEEVRFGELLSGWRGVSTARKRNGERGEKRTHLKLLEGENESNTLEPSESAFRSEGDRSFVHLERFSRLAEFLENL